MRIDPSDPQWSATQFRNAAAYVERSSRGETRYQREVAVVMAVECLAWSLYRQRADDCDLPLLRRAA